MDGIGPPTPIQGCENGARLDRWLDIGWTTNVEDLTEIPSYPDSPDETQFLGASLLKLHPTLEMVLAIDYRPILCHQ